MRYILIAVCFFTAPVFGQTVTGSWYGLADPSAKGANANNYLTELIIKQKGNEVEGVFGYYFRSGYQSYYVRGTYNPATRSLTIKNIPVTYYKSRDIDGIDCPMDLRATLMVSKVKSTLSGSFVSQEKYKYTCPELSFRYTLDVNEKNQDSLIRSNASNTKKYWKPRAEELVISAKEVSTPDAMAERMVSRETNDSAGKHSTIDSTAFKLAEAAKKKELEKLVTAFSARKNILNSEIEIESDSVRISFYDNGDIDGDSIAVFINKVPVLSHQPLSERALNMYLAMDSAHAITEISMYAENLGKFPPNTALMVVADGEKHHEVFLSSSLTQNAVVRLKKRKPAR
ncbi:MAG: hypothetical protein KGO82_15905 [Bacteroidota bacterium]|nr:hypothetical protein [Bacteroidota bacterium]